MAIKEDCKITKTIDEVRTPMNLVLQILVQVDLVNEAEKTKNEFNCLLYQSKLFIMKKDRLCIKSQYVVIIFRLTYLI